MKKIVCIALLASVLACNNSEENSTNGPRNTGENGIEMLKNSNNDLALKNLYGKVQTREVWAYKATVNNGKVSKGDLIGGLTVLYNEKGNMVTSTSYKETKEEAFKWEYAYNGMGDLIESRYKDAHLTRKLVSQFDDKGNLIETKEFVNDELIKTSSFKYNDKNQEIEAVDVFASDYGESKRVHKYDNEGNRRETMVLDDKGALNLKQLFSYDNNKRMIKQTIFTADNAPSYKKTYEFDQDGNPSKELAFGPDGQANASECFKYKYEYNGQKNWLQRITYDYNDVAQELVEQKLVYYKPAS